MTKTYHILIPERVPLDNKGEEAIVRGMSDVLFPRGNCEIHLFDMVDEYRFQDGIHVYPGKWFFSPWLVRDFGLGLTWEKLRNSMCSLTRNALHQIYPGWVRRRCAPFAATAERMKTLATGRAPKDDKDQHLLRLLKCDYVIAGHDGALNEHVCHVVDVLRELGVRCGVFGVDLRTAFLSRAMAEVHQATMQHCHFFYCRTAKSAEAAKRFFPDVHSELLPDPAFGMQPAPDHTVDKVISAEGLEAFFRRPVIMCTCCEPGPIARDCFKDIHIPDMKLRSHRKLFAELIQHIVQTYDVNVLFLPHAVGPGSALDDRRIARDILHRAQLPPDRARLLATTCSARELKGFLKRSECLVAERVHSVIGATGVGTPFLCMGSNGDNRIRGIVQEMLGMEQAVYFLNRPTLCDLKAKFDELWEQRAALRRHLEDTSLRLRTRLEEAAIVMRGCIGSTDHAR